MSGGTDTSRQGVELASVIHFAAISDDGIDLDAMVLAFEHLLQVSDTADRRYDLFWELDAQYS